MNKVSPFAPGTNICGKQQIQVHYRVWYFFMCIRDFPKYNKTVMLWEVLLF